MGWGFFVHIMRRFGTTYLFLFRARASMWLLSGMHARATGCCFSVGRSAGFWQARRSISWHCAGMERSPFWEPSVHSLEELAEGVLRHTSNVQEA